MSVVYIKGKTLKDPRTVRKHYPAYNLRAPVHVSKHYVDGHLVYITARDADGFYVRTGTPP